MALARLASHPALRVAITLAGSGADTNTGADEAHPWIHAPGMPTCVSNCASVTPAPGQGFIFRGGDTWHFGASTSPATGGTWTWNWSGTPAKAIYIGVDLGWFSGASWARPIMNGDNPLSTTPVASCAHTVGSNNVILAFGNVSYTTTDNLEFLGLCQDNSTAYGHNVALSDGAGNQTYEHLYFHGWTHKAYSCSGGVGTCMSTQMIEGNSGQNGTVFTYIVIDGSDSDPTGAAAIFNTVYDIDHSVIRYTANLLGGNCHTFHDNLVEYSQEPGDNDSHGNVYECSGEVSASTPNTFYNNLIRHVGTIIPLGVNIWPEPNTGSTDYYFNNVFYDIHAGMNYFDIGQNSGPQGTLDIFSNTFEQTDNQVVFGFLCSYPHPFNAVNNHYITDASSPYSGGNCQGTYTTDLAMTHATTTADGYTATETYAYSPPMSNSPTVSAGTNEAAYCTALLNAGETTAAAACQYDTGYGCAYNSNNHTISCPGRASVPRPTNLAWDIGAYQFSGSEDPPPPPSNLQAMPQ